MKKCISIAVISILFSAIAFAGISPDIQAGISYSAQKESYTDSGIDYVNKTQRTGFNIENCNTFDSGFGFFENLNFEFSRNGSAEVKDKTYDYNDDSFFAFELIAGPSYQFCLNDTTKLQFGAGFHYLSQKWTEDDFTYGSTSMGLAILFNYKLKLTGTWFVTAGASAFFDFKNSLSYTYGSDSYTIPASSYCLIGVQPHLLIGYQF
jgi:hypothetical protein